MDQVVAALDVGGTSIKAALVDRRGQLRYQTRRATGVQNGPEAVVDGIVDLAGELVDTPGVSVVGVGIGAPGTVESEAGIARYAANLGWRDVPLTALVAARTHVPVTLDHDVRTAVLAEARWGAGAGEGSMFFLAIGTGIAGGLARLGVVDDGATGLAGEIGHLVVRPGGPACFCGSRGCLEAIASASRIAARYTAVTGREHVSAEQVVTLVREGESAAEMIWGEAMDALADALAAATILMDPGRFVVGGGLSLAGRTLTDPLEAALARRLTFRPAPPVTITVLGDRAGVMGAALRVWLHLDSPERRSAPHPDIADQRDLR